VVRRVIQARSSGKKPLFFWLPAPVFQVDVVVGDVDVAAQHKLALFQGRQMRINGIQKPVLGFLPFWPEDPLGK
jgi:hypothetical protein